jgi:hypothetical protein
MAATDLLYTVRKGGLSSHAPLVYVVHRPDCSHFGKKARPLSASPDPERILRKARTGLNASACSFCKPDVSA